MCVGMLTQHVKEMQGKQCETNFITAEWAANILQTQSATLQHIEHRHVTCTNQRKFSIVSFTQGDFSQYWQVLEADSSFARFTTIMELNVWLLIRHLFMQA